jgi:hypothetical protein
MQEGGEGVLTMLDVLQDSRDLEENANVGPSPVLTVMWVPVLWTLSGSGGQGSVE